MMRAFKLVGGPRDGDSVIINEDAKLIMATPKPEDGDLDHVIAHAYLPRGDGEHFDYAGKKSRHELNAELGNYRVDMGQHDDSEWWKR